MLDMLTTQLGSIESDSPAQWMEFHFVSGVKHLPVRYCFRRRPRRQTRVGAGSR